MRRTRVQVGKRLLAAALLVCLLAAAYWSAIPLAVQFQSGRARRFLQRRNNQQALPALRLALRLAPDHAESHFLLARAHRRLGNLDRVEPLLRRAEQLGSDATRAERERWLLLAQAGKLREAEPHLGTLLADARDDSADICEAFVRGYFANLRTQEALQLLDAWQRDYPGDAQSYFLRGYLMQALAKREEAAAAYRRGLELAPGETLMRCRLAEVLSELHHRDEAQELFRRCAAEEPENAKVLTAWASSLTPEGDIDEARRLLDRVLAAAPQDFEALRQLGELELSAGNFAQALERLQAAAHRRPYDTTTHNALGKTLRALGRDADAQVHFDYVVRAEESLARMERQLRLVVDRPADVDLRYDIGTTLLKYGAPEDGVKWLRTVFEIQPDHAATHQALAAYYARVGDAQNEARHRRPVEKP